MTGELEPMTAATYLVTGLTCDHCARAVAGELRNIGGVSDVAVQLVPGGQSAVAVVSAAPLTLTAVSAALAAAGEYQVADGS